MATLTTDFGCIRGPVVQLVRTPACHAGGREFESLPGRHFFAVVAQMVEHHIGSVEVTGSIPVNSSKKDIRTDVFFYPLRRQWYIVSRRLYLITRSVHIITEGVYFSNDDIQSLRFDDMQFLQN